MDKKIIELLNFLIADEQEAIKGYQDVIAQINDKRIVLVLEHIVGEEMRHIEELNELLIDGDGFKELLDKYNK